MILFVVYYLPDGIVGFVRNLFFSAARRCRQEGPGQATGRAGCRARQRRDPARGQGRADAIRRPEGAEPGGPDRQARHHPRPDRPQRLGQEHHDERADRHLRADGRLGGLLRQVAGGPGAGRHRRLRRGPHLPERAAVRRDDGAGKRAGGPAPYLQHRAGRHRAAHARLEARGTARAGPRPGAAGVRRPGGPGQRGSAQPALRQAAPAGNRPRWRWTRSCCCWTSRPPA